MVYDLWSCRSSLCLCCPQGSSWLISLLHLQKSHFQVRVPSRAEFGGYFIPVQVPAVGGQHARIPSFPEQGSPSITLSGPPTPAGALLGPARELSPSLEG